MTDAEEVKRLRSLCDRWNRAVTRYSPIAGSEYIDDPERSLAAIKSATAFSVGLAAFKAAKRANQDAGNSSASEQLQEKT